MPRKPMDGAHLLEFLRRQGQLHLHRMSHDHNWTIRTEPRCAGERGLCGTPRCLIIRLALVRG